MEKRALRIGGPVTSTKQFIHSTKGQSLIELTFITPLMLLLVFGVVEVGSIISTYLTLTHTTREGANLTSRGTDPDKALTAIIAAAAPSIRDDNKSQWKIIYTRIIQDPACVAPPCSYIVDEQIDNQGSLGQNSKIAPGGDGSTVTPTNLPGIETVGPNQKFHAIEVYYDYTPNVITFVGNGLNKLFYDRTIFTNVSGVL
jgi:TadE-like protein